MKELFLEYQPEYKWVYVIPTKQIYIWKVNDMGDPHHYVYIHEWAPDVTQYRPNEILLGDVAQEGNDFKVYVYNAEHLNNAFMKYLHSVILNAIGKISYQKTGANIENALEDLQNAAKYPWTYDNDGQIWIGGANDFVPEGDMIKGYIYPLNNGGGVLFIYNSSLSTNISDLFSQIHNAWRYKYE